MSLNTEIALLERQIVDAPTLERAKALHAKYDLLVARREAGSEPPSESLREAWKRGYNSGYQAGLRRGRQR